uniref:hypothetical protein n=1 Tax=Mycoplasmopsis bovis TaxID=28903 RepID=UPI003D2B7C17
LANTSLTTNGYTLFLTSYLTKTSYKLLPALSISLTLAFLKSTGFLYPYIFADTLLYVPLNYVYVSS